MKMPENFYFKSKYSNLAIYYATRYKDSYFVSCGGAPAQKWSKEDLKSKILNGDFIIHPKYKWRCPYTGELSKNIWEVIRNSWVNLIKFHNLTLKWQYRKEGF